MIPIPEPDLQWGEGTLAKVVERPLPTHARPGLSNTVRNVNVTGYKNETTKTTTGKLTDK